MVRTTRKMIPWDFRPTRKEIFRKLRKNFTWSSWMKQKFVSLKPLWVSKRNFMNLLCVSAEAMRKRNYFFEKPSEFGIGAWKAAEKNWIWREAEFSHRPGLTKKSVLASWVRPKPIQIGTQKFFRPEPFFLKNLRIFGPAHSQKFSRFFGPDPFLQTDFFFLFGPDPSSKFFKVLILNLSEILD